MTKSREPGQIREDATDRLRESLNNLRLNKLGPAEVRATESDVRVCAERLAGLQARGGAFAGVEFSEDMQKLYKLVGKKKERVRFSLLSKAAAL
ncbi:MAG: hypothetical protein RDV41_15150 [Planctomycetota bacterium]|nr:hypothetical protein [Planctomycetota bacterium]